MVLEDGVGDKLAWRCSLRDTTRRLPIFSGPGAQQDVVCDLHRVAEDGSLSLEANFTCRRRTMYVPCDEES